MTPSDSPERTRRRHLQAAAEKTAPSSEFSADALRREAEATRVDSLERTPQQCLHRTASDRAQTSSADRTSTLTSFDESSAVLPDFAPGEHEGGQRYAIVNHVGKGATSRVYAVEDRSLGRTMAVKFLRRVAASPDSSVRRRFLHEARVTAMIEHPDIMPIHDIGAGKRWRRSELSPAAAPPKG